MLKIIPYFATCSKIEHATNIIKKRIQKMRKIRLSDSSNIEKLSRIFKVSQRQIHIALSGERSSDLCQRIRIMAMELEPTEITYEPTPNETITSWEDGAVMLRYRKNENDAQILVHGEPKAEPRVVDCSEYHKMYKECARIAINM